MLDLPVLVESLPLHYTAICALLGFCSLCYYLVLGGRYWSRGGGDLSESSRSGGGRAPGSITSNASATMESPANNLQLYYQKSSKYVEEVIKNCSTLQNGWVSFLFFWLRDILSYSLLKLLLVGSCVYWLIWLAPFSSLADCFEGKCTLWGNGPSLLVNLGTVLCMGFAHVSTLWATISSAKSLCVCLFVLFKGISPPLCGGRMATPKQSCLGLWAGPLCPNCRRNGSRWLRKTAPPSTMTSLNLSTSRKALMGSKFDTRSLFVQVRASLLQQEASLIIVNTSLLNDKSLYHASCGRFTAYTHPLIRPLPLSQMSVYQHVNLAISYTHQCLNYLGVQD